LKDIACGYRVANMICRSHLGRLIQHHNHHHALKSCNTNIQKRWISRTSTIKNNTSNTYYDSQSGQHVPIHNENEVSVYLRGIGGCSTQKVIDAAKQYGCSGSILQDWMNSDDNIVNDIPSISSTDNIYVHIKPELYLIKHPLEEQPFSKRSYNPCLEYKISNEDDIISIIKHVASDIQQDVSIGIFDSNINE
jgi:hypothetical protein